MERRAAEAGDTLLVIDDDPARRGALEGHLRAGRRLVLSSPSEAAGGILSSIAVDVAVVGFPPDAGRGVERLGEVRTLAPAAEVIAIAPAAEALVDECLRHGAVDVLEFPRDAPRLALAVDRALERRRLVESEALYQASRVLMDARTPEALAGAVAQLVRRALAADDAALLLADESGRLPEETGIAGAGPWLREDALRACALGVPLVLGPEGAPARGPQRLLLPLSADGRAVGVLVALRADPRRPFRGADLEKAALLGAQAQLALHNARLTHELVRTERLVAMGELLAGVSHEINNPIAFVRTNLRFVSDALGTPGGPSAADSEEIAAALADANLGLDRIAALLGDLRVLGRVETVALADVDVREAADAAARVAGADLKRCTLTIDVVPGLVARAEPGRFGQALVNLLLNAAHAAAQVPSSQRRVGLRAWAEGAFCVVEVSDTGPGVPEGLRERIFDAFFSTRADGQATGLGLTLARRVAETHGGSLALLPGGGPGATFRLRIPLGNPRQPPAISSGN